MPGNDGVDLGKNLFGRDQLCLSCVDFRYTSGDFLFPGPGDFLGCHFRFTVQTDDKSPDELIALSASRQASRRRRLMRHVKG
jgi:hypothetical protein